ncbi:type II toxin-antitoxin system HipA family toxin [soil metagenome]
MPAKRREAKECYVYIQLPNSMDVVTCGRFQHMPMPREEGVGRFIYGRSYLARRDAVPLDPYNLPLREGWRETARLGGVFGAIRDAAPDAWGSRVIERALGRVDLTILDYLLHSPEDRAGALSFGWGTVPPPPVRPFNRVIQLPALLDAASALEALEAGQPISPQLQDQLAHLLDLTSIGLGGARPKNVVEDAEGLWVAKFPSQSDRWNNASVEGALLALAGQCGIRVPPTRIETVGTKRVLFVKRFDRTLVAGAPTQPNRYLRSRRVSALTVLNAEETAASAADWSYVLLADELQRWSARPRDDKRELFRRMVFNALVSNLDDHPRNHALVAPGNEFCLSPAYDITPSRTQSRDRRDLAMICGSRGRAATRTNLVSHVRRFAMTTEEAHALIDEMKGIVAGEWQNELHRHAGSAADADAIRHAFNYPGFEYDVDAVDGDNPR